MKILRSISLAILASLAASAGNYEFRSDDLWVTTPDHSDWIYECGDSAKIEVQLYIFGVPQDSLVVNYAVAPDLQTPEMEGTLLLRNGRAVLNIGTMTEPGFRDVRFTAEVDGYRYRHHVKVGFSPEAIEPYTSMPDDFDDFWSANLDQLAKFPLKYTINPSDRYSTDKVDAYLVKLDIAPRGQAIYGYLFMPRDAEPGQCPIVVCPPGAGIKTIKEPTSHIKYAENGFIRFATDIHGLNPEMTDEQFAEISSAYNTGDNGYLTNNLDNRDNYYMKRVYLSLVRAVDFLTTLSEWDGRNIIMQGGSQGGALSIIGASLDPRVTACVANHPALADMGRCAVSGTDGYPHFSRMNGMCTPEKLNTMAYYDVVNFARNLDVPLYMTWGFNDDVCSPTTSYAVWNVVMSPKESLVTPINEHWTSQNTIQRQIDWIKNHLKPAPATK